MIARGDTKARILDEAEKLFGLNGFDAVSLRDITTAADVNLAAVNYHFQSKDALIDAIVRRHIEPINSRRVELLNALGNHPSVEGLLEAFLRPVFEIKREPVVPLMGRILSDPEMFVERIFVKHLSATGQRFSAALSEAMPGLPPEEVAWRLQFSIGVMTHTLLMGSVYPRLTNGMCSIRDREALLCREVQFLAAGFRAPASKLI